MPKAVLFDLDGVVTDTAELHYTAWQELADRYELPFDRQKNERLRGVSRQESLKIILDGRSCESDQFSLMLVEKNNRYLQLLEDISESDVLDGIPRFLDELSQCGIKVAIASSSKNARAIVDRLGLDECFAVVSDGNSVVRSKPAPDVFVHAAGQLAVNCRDCLVLEDAAAGVEGAKAAGMKTVGIGDHVAAAEPDVLFGSTSQVCLRSIEEVVGDV